MTRLNPQRFRYAQTMQLLELHHELTQRRRALTENFKRVSRELATVEALLETTEEHIRKI